MIVLAASVLATALSTPCVSSSAHQDDIAWFKQNCDPVRPEEDPRVAEAQRIIDTLGRQMRLLSSRRVELLVVRGLQELHAHTTSDGEVVLSSSALDFCDRRARQAAKAPDASRSCLAFILAHELMHVFHDDAPRALQERDRERRRQHAGAVSELEQRADEGALLHMLLAGYSPDVVIGGRHTPFKSTLLDDWAAVTRPSATPEPRDRTLRQILERVARASPLAEAGVLALEVGRYDLAIDVFSAFRNVVGFPGSYPGAEMLSDLGYAYHQLALAASCDATLMTRFRLPEVVDPDTPFKRQITRSADGCLRSAFEEAQLKQAVTNLRDAVSAAPTYVPARINLVAALITAGDFELAMHHAQDPFPGSRTPSESQRVALDNMYAVAQYLWGERDGLAGLRRQAISRLQNLALRAPDDDAVTYNLMMLLAAQLDASGQGGTYVSALRKASSKSSSPGAEAGADLAEAPHAPLDPAPVVSLGPIDDARRAALPKATTVAADPDWQLSVYRGPGWAAYAIDDTIELVIEELRPPVTVAQVQQQGMPRSEVRLTDERRVMRYKGVAYEVAGGQALRRITFLP